MIYLAGRYSSAEAQRIDVLKARSEETAPDAARQIFTTYLRAIENPLSYASLRAQREAFVDSLLELASFLGDGIHVAFTSMGLSPGDDPIAFIETYYAHPQDRLAKTVRITVEGLPAADSALRLELQALAAKYQVTLQSI
jgi:hypothetical protein